MAESSYAKGKLNSVNRLRNRGLYDYSTIHGIVNDCPVVHVAFASEPTEPFPTILPMIGQMASFQNHSASLDTPLDCYIHGYVSSRIMKLTKEAISRGEEGLPLCITATKLDGYVLALAPFHNSYNYRSAVLHGYAQVVEDEEEKLWALELITDSVVKRRWENSRSVPTKAEMTSTTVLRVKVCAGSAKTSSGLPKDDRKDERDEELTKRVWAGVVPIWEVAGEPITAPQTLVTEVPEHVTEYIRKTNDRNKEMALNAAKDPEK